jgi:hypothetical protein
MQNSAFGLPRQTLRRLSRVQKMMDPQHEIEHRSEFDRGGHFAAMETPDLLVGDVRRFFRTLR